MSSPFIVYVTDRAEATTALYVIIADTAEAAARMAERAADALDDGYGPYSAYETALYDEERGYPCGTHRRHDLPHLDGAVTHIDSWGNG